MKKGIGLSLVMILLVIIGVAIIDAGATRPVSWRRTYDLKDKQPYGLYVFGKEIANILGGDTKISTYGESTYEMLDSLKSSKLSNVAIVEIYDPVYFDDLDVKVLLEAVNSGTEVFISSIEISTALLDSLGLKTEELNYSIFFPSSNNISYSLGTDTSRLKLEKVQDFVVFSKLDRKTCTILGSIHARGRAIPNFIKVSYGKGYFYLHTLPEVFSNYHMLQADSYVYASKMLNVIQHKEILISDYYFNWEIPKTPLRVILTNPGFMQAWYILLFSLFVLLVFKSKREQRAVEIVLPEPNLSKEFAKTIATVYYENGDPGNILHKKIEYFLFAIRNTYNLETMNLLDEKFINQLAAKSTVDKEETNELMKLLHASKERNHFDIEDVKRINNRIEEFKSKANL